MLRAVLQFIVVAFQCALLPIVGVLGLVLHLLTTLLDRACLLHSRTRVPASHSVPQSCLVAASGCRSPSAW